MLQEIKIRCNQWHLWLGAFGSLVILVGISYIFLDAYDDTYWLTAGLLLVFFWALTTFSLCLRRIMSKNYAVVASHAGLFVDDFGLIPWLSIRSIEHYYMPSRRQGSHDFVCIKLHDINCIASNLSLFSKIRLYYFSLWSKNSIFLNLLEMHPIIAAQRLHDFMEQQKIPK